MIYALKERGKPAGVAESYRKTWRKILPYLWISTLAWFIIFGGFAAGIVPGVIFSFWFAFTAFVRVAEDKKGLSAVLKSREYVRGHWGGVFIRFLFLTLSSVGVSFILEAALSSLGEPARQFFGGYIVSLFLPPFLISYSYLLYENLKELRGDFRFVPKKKGLFIFFGILGVVFLLAVLTALLLFGNIISFFLLAL